ncbi:MAG: aminoacetone oxidase family FAD-binding enzyme [Bacillota bacterium]|nr:aminoacetone oxidase family FAD-binding enzyme [Eubacteriales bacterium]MDI9491633.1 aminoacetone oxidase family FAD-binding enzyme [Bacillota bacterium]
MEHQQDHDIVIIGAGASGLMAAAAASEHVPGRRILVLEKNPIVGKKLYATGNGRCNFLNRTACPADYYSRERSASSLRWIHAALENMPPSALAKIFHRMGVPAVEQEEGRLYPRSLQAESVVEALLYTIRSAGVSVRTDAAAEVCRRTSGGFVLRDILGNTYTGGCVILATGGKAGLQYGSQGDGYRLADALGHRIVKPIPALTQILLEDADSSLFGVRVRGEVSLWRSREGAVDRIARDEGEIQLTREGLSGICTFNISRFYEIEAGVEYTARLDFFPEYSPEKMHAILAERQQMLADRPVETFLKGMVPGKLADALLREAGVASEGVCGELSSGEVREIAEVSKGYRRRVAGTKSWKDAQVTAGGVSLAEVDPSTLLSKLVPGLFFAGEILDVDGPCGGYNLTWAFASGRIAGTAAGEMVCCG